MRLLHEILNKRSGREPGREKLDRKPRRLSRFEKESNRAIAAPEKNQWTQPEICVWIVGRERKLEARDSIFDSLATVKKWKAPKKKWARNALFRPKRFLILKRIWRPRIAKNCLETCRRFVELRNKFYWIEKCFLISPKNEVFLIDANWFIGFVFLSICQPLRFNF